jgi:hypothetical protein
MTEKQKAKRRLTDFNFEESGSHVALVHKEQGGPANLYTTLLTKSTSGITDQQVVNELTLIEKAKLNSQIRQELQDAVKAKFQDDKDEWLYLEDFDDTNAFFWRENSMYMVGYFLAEDGNYQVEDEAKSVEKEWFYVETGRVTISEQAKDKLEEGEYVLVNKALNNPETNSRVEKALAAFKQEKEKMQEEIQKAVAAKDAEIAALQAKVNGLEEIVKAAEEAKQEQMLKARETQVAEFLKDGAVELVKSTVDLSEEAFAQILKALGVQKAAVESSDLMNEVSSPNAAELGETNTTLEIIKARHAKK